MEEMKNDYANRAIHCTIEECANHCTQGHCCSLDSIQVCRCGSQTPTDCACTECASFQPKVK